MIVPQPQVSDAPMSGARSDIQAQPEAFGGGASAAGVQQATQGLATASFELAKAEKQKADDSATQDAYIQLSKVKNDMLYDPNNGALAKRGKQAFGVVQEYGPQYDEAASKVLSGLANNRQRELVERIVRREKNDFDSSLNRHVYQESKQFESASFQGTLDTSGQDALHHAEDPTAVAANLRLQQSTVLDYASKNGLPREWAQSAIEEAATKVHLGIITQKVDAGDTPAAQAWYDHYKDGIDPKSYHGIENMLKVSGTQGEARSVADGILADNATRGNALDAVDKIKDEDVRASAYQFVRQGIAERENRDWQGEVEFSKNALKYVETNREQPPASVLASASVADKKMISKRLDQISSGLPPTTDVATYYELKDMASNEPAKFMRLNLNHFAADMDGTSRAEMDKIQTGLLTQDQGEAKKIKDFGTQTQLVSDVWNQATGASALNKNKAEFSKFRDAVRQQVTSWQEDNKKPVTNDVVQKIADQLVIKGNVPGAMWGSNAAFSYQAKAGQVFTPDVPAVDREQITQSLRNAGKPVNEESVSRLYKLKVQNAR